MAQYDTALLSNFQHIIDHELQNGNLFIILCGSYMAFMKKKFSAQKVRYSEDEQDSSNLNHLIILKIFSLWKMEGFTNEEKLMFYEAFGGIEGNKFKAVFQVKYRQCFLHQKSYLYEKSMFLLREELQQPATYNAIIEAIAGGASKASEISSKADEESSKCLKYIKPLRDLDILYKEIPFGEKESSRRAIYGINDFMFRFWYRYIFNNKTLIETYGQEILWQYKIEPDYSTYMGLVFERACKEFLLLLNTKARLPFIFSNIGRWWSNDPHNKKQEGIDIIANDRNDYIFCECKWRNIPADISTLKTLQERANLILEHKDKNRIYFLFFLRTASLTK